jgi:hypothetical protein
MKAFRAALLAAAMAAAPIAAHAQDAPRPYDRGPVWDVAAIQVKPGHFDDYMRFLDTTWKAEQESLKARGLVLDYKVLSVFDARDNEPDLFLMVEWKNMGAFDTPLEEQDAMTRKLFGSVTQAMAAGAARETLRTERGDVLTRELILK